MIVFNKMTKECEQYGRKLSKRGLDELQHNDEEGGYVPSDS